LPNIQTVVDPVELLLRLVYEDQVKERMKDMDTQTTYSFTEQSNGNGLYGIDLDEDKIQLIRRTIARGASEDELALFVEQCRRTGLDPFARQIYSVRRKQWNSLSRSFEEAQVIQVSIDGFRLIADRTHKYSGQVGPWWCGSDGEWKEVWLSNEPPSAAKVGVLRHDFHQPLFAIALYKSYVQMNSQGDPISRWKTDPAGMLAKCAEALALRRAFPHELSGLYTTEEMDQADNPASAASSTSVTREPSEVTQVRVTTQRPFTPQMLRANFAKAVATIEAKGLLLGPDDYSITEDAVNNMLEDEHDRERYLEYVVGIPYLEDMNEAQVVALLRLLKPSNVENTFIPCEDAQSEAASVIAWLEAGDRENNTDDEDE
jgi:phage recombination protein Bet